MTKGYHKLSALEIITLSKVLEAEVETINGLSYYRDATKSDTSIAEALGPRYNNNMVASLRLKMFGPLKSTIKTDIYAQLLQRLEAFELWASLRPKSPFQF